jgi:hypothetical protein
MRIAAESTTEVPWIDEAILNQKDPIEYWKKDHPYERILSANYEVLYHADNHNNSFQKIAPQDFQVFLSKLNAKVDSDDLIPFVRSEFQQMQTLIKSLLIQLTSKMQ